MYSIFYQNDAYQMLHNLNLKFTNKLPLKKTYLLPLFPSVKYLHRF